MSGRGSIGRFAALMALSVSTFPFTLRHVADLFATVAYECDRKL